jgi:hypothetical protein
MKIPAASSVYALPYAIFPANDKDNPFIQVSPKNNRYTSLDSLIFPFITPLHLSKDTSLSLESSEDLNQSNGRGYRRTRRTRKLVVIVDARQTRKKHQG